MAEAKAFLIELGKMFGEGRVVSKSRNPDRMNGREVIHRAYEFRIEDEILIVNVNRYENEACVCVDLPFSGEILTILDTYEDVVEMLAYLRQACASVAMMHKKVYYN